MIYDRKPQKNTIFTQIHSSGRTYAAHTVWRDFRLLILLSNKLWNYVKLIGSTNQTTALRPSLSLSCLFPLTLSAVQQRLWRQLICSASSQRGSFLVAFLLTCTCMSKYFDNRRETKTVDKTIKRFFIFTYIQCYYRNNTNIVNNTNYSTINLRSVCCGNLGKYTRIIKIRKTIFAIFSDW